MGLPGSTRGITGARIIRCTCAIRIGLWRAQCGTEGRLRPSSAPDTVRTPQTRIPQMHALFSDMHRTTSIAKFLYKCPSPACRGLVPPHTKDREPNIYKSSLRIPEEFFI